MLEVLVLPKCCGGSPEQELSVATAVYETRVGIASLTWCRAAAGLSLRLELRGSFSGTKTDQIVFQVRPWLLWRRRGSRRFEAQGNHRVDLAWDLSVAQFSPGGSPEPRSGFFVSVSVDGEAILAVGDLADPPPPPSQQIQISRREHVILAEETRICYRTTSIGDREISIEVSDEREKEKERGDLVMSIAVGGKSVLHVRRLSLKFRGSEHLDIGDGERIRITWDLHRWVFPPTRHFPEPPLESTKSPLAVFVLGFEGSEIDTRTSPIRTDEDEGLMEPGDVQCGTPENLSGGRISFSKPSSPSSSSSASSSARTRSSLLDWVNVQDVQRRAAAAFSIVISFSMKC